MANGFIPNDAVQTLRSLSRLGHGNDITQILSSDKDEQIDYIYGVIFITIVLLIILIAWLIILGTLSCLGSKRVGFLSGHHFTQPAKSYRYYRPLIVRIIFIIIGSIVLGSCALLVTKGSQKFDDTIESFQNSTLAISNLVAETNEVSSSLIEIGNDAQRVRAVAVINLENFCPNVDFEEDLGLTLNKDDMIQSLDNLSDFVVDQATAVRRELRFIEDALISADSVLDRISTFRGSALYIVFPVAALTALLILGTLIACGGFTGRKLECFQTVCVMRLLLIVSIAFWIVGSIFVIIGIVNADYCSGGTEPGNPDDTAFDILHRFNLQENDPELYGILLHYIPGCLAEDPFDFLNEYKSELDMALVNMNVLLNSVEEISEEQLALICGDSISAELGIIRDLKEILSNLIDDADQVLDIIDCERINTIYVDAIHTGICTNLPNSTWWIFSFLLAIGVSGMMMVTLRSSWLEAEYIIRDEGGEVDVDSFMNGSFASISTKTYNTQNRIPQSVHYPASTGAVSALTAVDEEIEENPMNSSRSWTQEGVNESLRKLVPMKTPGTPGLKSV